MARPTAVHGGEAHLDGLAVVRHEVDTDSGPILPCGLVVARHVPTGSHTVFVRKLGVSAGLIDEVAVLVEHLKVETRLTFVVVSGRILEDDGILTDEDTLVGRIDKDIIGDRLGLTHIMPVAQTHRCQGAIGHSMQQAVGTRIDLSRIDVECMTALDSIRTKVDDTYTVVGRCTSMCGRVVTPGTSHVGAIEVNVVDTVVVRTVDEDLRHIDIVGAQGLVLLGVVERATDTYVVTALQDTLKRIGAAGTVLTGKAIRTFGDTAHAVGPTGLAYLTVLNIKFVGCTGSLPGDDQGRVLAMRINDHILRLLDSRGVDLEVIDSDTGSAQRILLIGVDPDEDNSEVSLRVGGIDTHRIGERYILPRLTTAYELLARLAQRLAYTRLGVGQTSTDLVDDSIQVVVASCGQVLLAAYHDVQF